jgi:hypothetical protein
MPVDHLQTLLRWERNSWLVALWDICVPGLHISRLRVDSGVKQTLSEFAEHAGADSVPNRTVSRQRLLQNI